jgi:manganese-dependent inorganic pyrophosphatase
MPDKIYIIGHKSPDLDSVAAAIALAELKNNSSNGNEYIASIAGLPNKETVFALTKFGFFVPEIMESAEEKNIIMVDHNEFQQAVDGMDKAKILEIVDHHKFDFKYAEPILIDCRPWGASCSIIKSIFDSNNIAVSRELAGLMLSAILIDTVITKSPTCTDVDKKIISELSILAGIDDWQAFGMELFSIRSSVKELTIEQIIKNDFKDFNYKAGKFGIGQIETANPSELSERETLLLSEMDKMRQNNDYHSVILFITDIIKQGSLFLISSEEEDKIEMALGKKLENKKTYIDGIMSRKKQVLPLLEEYFNK